MPRQIPCAISPGRRSPAISGRPGSCPSSVPITACRTSSIEPRRRAPQPSIPPQPTGRDMSALRPKYITFDCYGTLTRFRMSDMTREIFADRIDAARMDAFVRDFAAYRLDEVLGAWKPYADVIKNAVRRTC